MYQMKWLSYVMNVSNIKTYPGYSHFKLKSLCLLKVIVHEEFLHKIWI